MNANTKKRIGVQGEQQIHKDVYVAFIDVIGAREFSASTAQFYTDRIIEFQKALYEQQLFLNSNKNDCAVYVYSDCAFMYSKSSTALLDYLTQVRKYAYCRGNGGDNDPLFFKAAIVKGDFESIDVCHLATRGKINGGGKKAIPDNIVEGISFSWRAVEVYLAHERSKAIGIWVSPSAAKDKSINKKLLNNIHFPLNQQDGPQVFTDVRFIEEELVDSVLDDILGAFFKAKVKSKKFEKYYVPILCNWIQSLDIKSLTREDPKLDQLKEGNGRMLYLLGTGYFERAFSTVRGLGYFYLTVLNHIYNTYFITRNPDNDTESIEPGIPLPKSIKAVEGYLLRLKRVQSAIPSMPQEFMGAAARRIFLDRLTKLR